MSGLSWAVVVMLATVPVAVAVGVAVGFTCGLFGRTRQTAGTVAGAVTINTMFAMGCAAIWLAVF